MRLGRFFSAPKTKGGLHTRKILQRRRRRKRRRRERGGVFFYPVATKRARIARESARETRCDRARAGGDVAFSSSSLFRTREGAAVWIWNLSHKGGKISWSVSLVDLFDVQSNRTLELTEAPLPRTNEWSHERTGQLQDFQNCHKARAGFSVNAAVRLLFVYLVGLFWIEFTKSSLKKKRKFYRFLFFFEENFDSSTHRSPP